MYVCALLEKDDGVLLNGVCIEYIGYICRVDIDRASYICAIYVDCLLNICCYFLYYWHSSIIILCKPSTF